MKIALVGDIHSNQFAFNAVLNRIEHENIDQVIFLGDYAFGGSGSVEVVDRLINYKAHPYIAIQGNKERYIKAIEDGEKLHPVLSYIYQELGNDRIDFLKKMPQEVSVEIENIHIRICHNPCKEKIFMVSDRLRRSGTLPNFDTLNMLAADMKEDICLFGHYHLYMNETVGSKRFVCACSVGLPFDGDSKAKFLIMNIQDGTVNIEKKSVEYDRSCLVDDFEKKGYFEKFDEWSMNTVISMMTGCNYIGTQDLRRR